MSTRMISSTRTELAFGDDGDGVHGDVDDVGKDVCVDVDDPDADAEEVDREKRSIK